ncbi:uncharacterized protein MICPUCDRAFT_53690 [Micromonas pusilla CCMP1545]|uniref:Predicted protein n=1 Tax=Micromonas pusilla (strain CCMP1545) TaxID=564608 RepID=C1N7G9_MICPC|nr:uncharacterized protein MICPUCDRAFT_53690 [Micromonas pusilla CCMP1545]EEH52269.1 predicted protein [Micromonas pusilla CCMP1545]|eukprot:XP_003063896.1 predicted protein [Micromonas pusilla CCMP1545]
MTSSDFAFPDFFYYPPYFTVQPTPETFRKQCELWKSLVLRCAPPRHGTSSIIRLFINHLTSSRPVRASPPSSSPLPDDRSTPARARARALVPPLPPRRRYCAHHALFVLNLDDVSLPLFDNPNVKRRLTLDARRTFVDALVADGNATWLDDDGGDDGKHRALILWRSVPEWGERLMQWARDGGREGAVVTIDEIRARPFSSITLVPVRPRRRGERRFLRTFSPGARSFLSAQGPSVSTFDPTTHFDSTADAFELRPSGNRRRDAGVGGREGRERRRGDHPARGEESAARGEGRGDRGHRRGRHRG